MVYQLRSIDNDHLKQQLEGFDAIRFVQQIERVDVNLNFAVTRKCINLQM